jgi:hypothetical protein
VTLSTNAQVVMKMYLLEVEYVEDVLQEKVDGEVLAGESVFSCSGFPAKVEDGSDAADLGQYSNVRIPDAPLLQYLLRFSLSHLS